jgi:hypothetical protein
MAKFARLNGNPHSEVTALARRQSRHFQNIYEEKAVTFLLPISWNPYDRRGFNKNRTLIRNLKLQSQKNVIRDLEEQDTRV